MNTIDIMFKNGTVREITDWDDYEYMHGLFIVKQNGAWTGIYNIDSIVYIEVK